MSRIAYFGGCWAPNIGNAFIDYGSMYTCQKYNPVFYSEYNAILFGSNRANYYNTVADTKPQCAVFSGMVTCAQFIPDQRETLDIIDALKIPIVLNGVGGDDYSQREISIFRDFIKKHKFAGFISRDDRSFEAYKDLFPLSFKGVDVGFFVSDMNRFQFLRELPKKYTVINNDDLLFNRDISSYEEYQQAIKDGSIVYCHHQVTNLQNKSTCQPRTMIAELPEEYIYLYGQSKMVFATRVHACIMALSFGSKCFQPYHTPRSCIFETIGCGNITREPCTPDMNVLAKRKSEHLNGLEQIMRSILL